MPAFLCSLRSIMSHNPDTVIVCRMFGGNFPAYLLTKHLAKLVVQLSRFTTLNVLRFNLSTSLNGLRC